MSQLHFTGAASLLCNKQAKHESILRVEKFAFVPHAISECLELCWCMQNKLEQMQHVLLNEKKEFCFSTISTSFFFFSSLIS